MWKTHTAALPTVWISKGRSPNASQIKKLIHAFRNSRVKIHLESDSADTAADIMQNWNKVAMGTDTSVTNPRGKCLLKALIIKRVDAGISNETLAEPISGHLHTDTENVTTRRFNEIPDNARMSTVNLTYRSRKNYVRGSIRKRPFCQPVVFQTYRIHRKTRYSRDQMLQMPET